MDKIKENLLKEIVNLEEIPKGAYNIRANGKGIERNTTANIDIITKNDKSGIDIIVKENTRNESIHIPVIITEGGLKDLVYNDFYIGENSEVVIVAGCGIHNSTCETSEHNGIHSFHLEKNAKVKYIEKHYGEGEGVGKRILNPVTKIFLKEGATLEMETVQIKGVDSTLRQTTGSLDKASNLIVKEIVMTHGKQIAKTNFDVELNGEDASCHIVSRAVAKDKSSQKFISKVTGNSKCFAHVECDAIIMDKATIGAVPEINANNLEAKLIHEAAIGKIAGEQILKLMTLGLSEKQAEEQIINGFLQ